MGIQITRVPPSSRRRRERALPRSDPARVRPALRVAQHGGRGYAAAVLPGICLLGLGIALAVTPLTTTVLGAVDARETGAASGINNAVARVAGLLAIAVLGVVASGRFDRALDRNLSEAGFSDSAAQRTVPDSKRRKLGAAHAPSFLSEAERARVEKAITRSFEEAFRLVMGVAAGLALLAAGSAAVGFGAAQYSADRSSG